MEVPRTWQALATFLGVPERLSRAVWAGVSRAQWSTAVELRQAFLLHEPINVETGGRAYAVVPFAITGLTAHAASPWKLIRALEACVQEKVVSRRDVSQFEQYVLAGMGHDASGVQTDTHRLGWLPGPAPDGTRWLTRNEREARAQHFHRKEQSYGTTDHSDRPHAALR
jgi:hypothetical protein